MRTSPNVSPSAALILTESKSTRTYMKALMSQAKGHTEAVMILNYYATEWIRSLQTLPLAFCKLFAI